MADTSDSEQDRSPKGPKKESAIVRELKDHGTLLGASVGVLWVVQLINAIGGHWLDRFGVIPRSLTGLKGILFAPFLHGSWGHLVANTVPLLILGWMVMLRRKRDFFTVAGVSGLVAGVGTWLIGATNSVHIGASGVVFGLIGYLISRGVMERKFWSILAAVVTLFLYGGATIGGILGAGSGISWEGHLFGLIGGIIASYYMLKDGKKAAAEPKMSPSRTRIATTADDAPQPKLSAAARIQDEEFESESELEKELAALRRRKQLTTNR
jgi:membrane associated rhomboid family serine protease